MKSVLNILKRTHVSEGVKNVIILGAAGRDFHDFNCFFRDNEEYNVVAFTATQIPDIEGRLYPPVLSGKQYPDGIPIYDELDLPSLIKDLEVEECVLSYSDLHHVTVMNLASTCLASGADFRLLGPEKMMLPSSKPIVSVNATRTGCGKSQTSRKIVDWFNQNGIKAVAARHPMPYGNLEEQVCQRYEDYSDLDKYNCTIEEMEEYEPYIERGLVIYAGVDYQMILEQAEQEADVIIWDGGNNDLPFFQNEIMVHFVVADPHRPNHEITYHPGETNFKMGDVIIINKIDSAPPEGVEIIEANAKRLNPDATLIYAKSPCTVSDPDAIKGKKVLIIEDGPTLTHGDMTTGAGVVAAIENGCEIVDPRPFAVGAIKDTLEKYPHLTQIVPAMGYGEQQMKDLEATINGTDCEAVIVGTPIDLSKHINIEKPNYRVVYNLDEQGTSVFDVLEEKLLPFLK